LNLQIKNTDKSKLIVHAIFWATWIISFTVIQSLGGTIEEYFIWFMYYIITLPIFVVHTYLIAYLLLPKTFFNNRKIIFGLGFCLLLIVFSVLELIVSNELVFSIFDNSKTFDPGYLNAKNVIISGIGNHFIIFVFLAIKAVRSWHSANIKKEKLVQTNAETKLETYRYQIQPIIVLTLMEELELVGERDEKSTPEMIVRISAFLNQFLYEGREELIPMHTEVKLMETYMEIHKIGLEKRLTSNIVHSGNLNSFVIPPLLLMPFINNAIKHAYTCNNLFEITVVIKGEKKYLLISFTFWSDKEFKFDESDSLKIIQNRLKFSYSGKNRIIENTDDNFREISIEIFN